MGSDLAWPQSLNQNAIKTRPTHERDNMTAETPKHDDLLAALADLPPRKVEKFAIALGIPKNVVEESQINNPKDIYRVKSDALDWWIRNENASWEAIAKALETKGIDERNLARRIRSSHGLVSAENGKSVALS